MMCYINLQLTLALEEQMAKLLKQNIIRNQVSISTC